MLHRKNKKKSVESERTMATNVINGKFVADGKKENRCETFSWREWNETMSKKQRGEWSAIWERECCQSTREDIRCIIIKENTTNDEEECDENQTTPRSQKTLWRPHNSRFKPRKFEKDSVTILLYNCNNPLHRKSNYLWTEDVQKQNKFASNYIRRNCSTDVRLYDANLISFTIGRTIRTR